MLYWIVSRMSSVFLFFMYRIRIVGKENVPKTGGFVFVGNHRSNVDVIIASAKSPRRLNFMAKKELFSNKLFGYILSHLGAFPVDRSRGDLGAIKAALSRLKKEQVVLLFPEGTRRKKDAPKEDAKQGAVMLSIKANVPIVPFYIKGEYKFMNKLTMEFGKPIYYNDYYDKKLEGDTLQNLSNDLLEKIYAFGDVVNK